MELKEIKEKKQILIDNVYKLLSEFEKETETDIDYINYEIMTVDESGYKMKYVRIDTKV